MLYYVAKSLHAVQLLSVLLLPAVVALYLFERSSSSDGADRLQTIFNWSVAALFISYLLNLLLFFVSQEVRELGRSGLEKMIDGRSGIDPYWNAKRTTSSTRTPDKESKS
jgi:hypothetical protein